MLRNKIFATATALTLALSIAGCTLVSVNPEKDFVADVNGTKITAAELDAMVAQYAQFYAMFGMDMSSPEQLESMKQDVLDGLIEQEVIKQQAKAKGFDVLTAEEQQAVDAEYAEMIQGYKEEFRATAESEAAADATINVETRMEELFQAELTNQKMTLEEIKQGVTDNTVYQKLEKSVYDTVVIGEEDIKGWYDTELAAQKSAVEADKTSYVGRQSAGDALYVPEGYVFVKHILIGNQPSEEDAAKISELEADQKVKSEEMTALILEDKQKNAAKIDELTAQINASKDEVTAINAKADGPAKTKADEVYAKASAAGADFGALVAEFGEDPGMTQEPGMTQGYLVGEGTNYVQPFIDASMALKADGDVSAPVKSDYGYHIIKRIGTPVAGEVAYDTVKDVAKEKVTNQKQSAAWTEAVDAWKAQTKIS